MISRTLGRERICWKTRMHILHPHRFALFPESILFPFFEYSPPRRSFIRPSVFHLLYGRESGPELPYGCAREGTCQTSSLEWCIIRFFCISRKMLQLSIHAKEPTKHSSPDANPSQPASPPAQGTKNKKSHAASTRPPPQILPETSPNSPSSPPKKLGREKKPNFNVIHLIFSRHILDWTAAHSFMACRTPRSIMISSEPPGVRVVAPSIHSRVSSVWS